MALFFKIPQQQKLNHHQCLYAAQCYAVVDEQLNTCMHEENFYEQQTTPDVDHMTRATIRNSAEDMQEMLISGRRLQMQLWTKQVHRRRQLETCLKQQKAHDEQDANHHTAVRRNDNDDDNQVCT